EIEGKKAIVTLDYFGEGLRPFGVEDAIGFAVCGEDKAWHWAKGKILPGDKIEVSSEEVAKPVAVLSAWGDNPACNLYSRDGGLPVPPFRTDDFDMTTKPKPPTPPAPAK